MMKLISANVGLLRQVTWKGKPVMTGIFKEPVNTRVTVRELNLDGDGQADLTVHGGVDRSRTASPRSSTGSVTRKLARLFPGADPSSEFEII